MNKDDCLVGRLSIRNNHGQSVDAKGGGDAAGAQHAQHVQLFPQRHLQGAGERDGEQEKREVADDADDGVARDDGALVEALIELAHPVGADGVADEDLDEEARGVVQAVDGEEGPDAVFDLLVDAAEDAGDDEEERDFDHEGHGGVEDGGGVT